MNSKSVDCDEEGLVGETYKNDDDKDDDNYDNNEDEKGLLTSYQQREITGFLVT